MCKMCLKEFTPHGSHVTCSKLCSLENKRQFVGGKPKKKGSIDTIKNLKWWAR